MHADRTNRLVLIVIAALALAVGTLGFLAGLGVFGDDVRHRPLVDNPVSRYFGDHGEWLWPVVAAAAGVLALAALYWLWKLLFSTDRAAQVRWSGRAGGGRTTLLPGALTEAVSGEVADYPGVSRARSRLLGDPDRPTLVITADLEETADLPAVRRRLEDEAAVHARQALEKPDLPVQIDLTVTSRRAPRVA